ncbi:unnamed protein product [Closterium sp. Naga37s-1]|nr:unnamed protein product [Closterium sp. Naga37s-1]
METAWATRYMLVIHLTKISTPPAPAVQDMGRARAASAGAGARVPADSRTHRHGGAEEPGAGRDRRECAFIHLSHALSCFAIYRIWGEHGQRALEQARVCLLTAGPTGTEALKNLVLGGIGSFTVVDGATVEAHDLGNNYFRESWRFAWVVSGGDDTWIAPTWALDRTHLGKSRAQAVTALLQELNESVAARFVEESPATLIQDNATFFSEFTLVIATQLPESVLLQLDSVCRQHGCQLIVARSYGLMGLIRISSPEHCVVEAKPDNTVDDLIRIPSIAREVALFVVLTCSAYSPPSLPACRHLRQGANGFDLGMEEPMLHMHLPFILPTPIKDMFAEGFDLGMEDAMLHSHIPYAVVLLHAYSSHPPPSLRLPFRIISEGFDLGMEDAMLHSHITYALVLLHAYSSHPPPSLRLPFRIISEGFDLGMEDAMLHSHIPYAVILLQAAQQWQQGGGRGEAGEAGAGGSGGGEEAAPVAMQADGEGQGGADEPRALPRSAKERSEFKVGRGEEVGEEGRGGVTPVPHALIAAHQRHMDEDNFKEAPRKCILSQHKTRLHTYAPSQPHTPHAQALIAAHQRHMDEDNFKEALAAAYKVWSPPPIGSELQAMFTDAAMQLSHASSDFWVLAAALKLFVEKEGEGDLPVDGAIPDMHSLTDFYVALQRIYLSKADADVAAVQRHVSDLLKSIGRDPASIPLATVKLFCKNARNLRVVRFKPLSEEFGAGAPACIPTLQRLMSSPDGSHAALYVLLRGADHFYSQFHRYPGSFPGDVDDDDVARLKSLAGTIVSGGGSPSQSPSIPDDLTAEMCRFGASELHCVAAVIGGVASQEAIKLITKQFVPVSGTLIYNGISQSSSVINFS